MSEIRKLQGVEDLSRILPLKWLSSSNFYSGWLLVQNFKFLRRYNWLSIGWVSIPEWIILRRASQFITDMTIGCPTLCINESFHKVLELNSTLKAVYYSMPNNLIYLKLSYLCMMQLSHTELELFNLRWCKSCSCIDPEEMS